MKYDLKFVLYKIRKKHKKVKQEQDKMVKIQKLPSGQLVITIPKTIAEYEDMLEIAEDESQQKIVKATLKTLHKQLKEVEIMETRKK